MTRPICQTGCLLKGKNMTGFLIAVYFITAAAFASVVLCRSLMESYRIWRELSARPQVQPQLERRQFPAPASLTAPIFLYSENIGRAMPESRASHSAPIPRHLRAISQPAYQHRPVIKDCLPTPVAA